MVNSMTGYATAKGSGAGFSWAWEMRSVNARGFDLRLRIPDWVDGLEQAVRAAVGKAATRGNLTLSLRLSRDEVAGEDRLDEAALARMLGHLATVEAQAATAGVTLRPTSGAELLSIRGVLSTATQETEMAGLSKALCADLPDLLAAFNGMRQSEGAALNEILTAQLDRVEELVATAAEQAEARKERVAEKLRENLGRILANSDGADPDRVAQELALMAVKADVTEEIDRLRTHVAAARDLLIATEAVGRKLDFLAQEFNREANTLCSKSQSAELTQTGLELKAVIDQMREQVQNVE